MKKVRYVGLLLVVLIGFGTVRAQLRFEKTIKPQEAKEGAQFTSIAVTEFDDIYLLESKFSEIYRLNQNGTILNRNGGFGWGPGQFDRPADLCVSGLDIMVADCNNHRLLRYDRKLNYIATQDLSSDSRRLIYPLSVASSRINEIFILSGETAEVLRLYVEKNEQTWFGGIEYGQYALDRPVSLRLNENGLLTVLQQDGSLVQFDRFGNPLGIIPFPDSLKAASNVLGLTAVKENWLVLTGNYPFVYEYSAKSREWHRLILSGLRATDRVIGLAFQNDRLYLLNADGGIAVFANNKLRLKP